MISYKVKFYVFYDVDRHANIKTEICIFRISIAIQSIDKLIELQKKPTLLSSFELLLYGKTLIFILAGQKSEKCKSEKKFTPDG